MTFADGAACAVGAARWRCQLADALHAVRALRRTRLRVRLWAHAFPHAMTTQSVRRCIERTNATVHVLVQVLRSECTASIAVHAAYERTPHERRTQEASRAGAHTSGACSCPCSAALALDTATHDDDDDDDGSDATRNTRRCGSMAITTRATRATSDAVLPDECVQALLAAARAAQLASRTAVVSVHVDGGVLLRPPPPCDAAGMFSPQASLHIAHVVGYAHMPRRLTRAPRALTCLVQLRHTHGRRRVRRHRRDGTRHARARRALARRRRARRERSHRSGAVVRRRRAALRRRVGPRPCSTRCRSTRCAREPERAR